jgi:predicted cupin superfamily sugar epimerase
MRRPGAGWPFTVRTVDAIIKKLGLEPHPERGYFRETYRASSAVQSDRHTAGRAASTAIYFLITAMSRP